MRITLIEVKCGDSSGMRETVETEISSIIHS